MVLAAILSNPADAVIVYFNTSDSSGLPTGTGEFRDVDTDEVLTTVSVTTTGQFERFDDGTNFINILEGGVAGYTFEFADRVEGLALRMSNFSMFHTSNLTLDSTQLTNPDLFFAENGFNVNSTSGLITGGGSGSNQGNGRFNLGEADRLILNVTGTPSAGTMQGFLQMTITGVVPEPANAGLLGGLLGLLGWRRCRNRSVSRASVGCRVPTARLIKSDGRLRVINAASMGD